MHPPTTGSFHFSLSAGLTTKYSRNTPWGRERKGVSTGRAQRVIQFRPSVYRKSIKSEHRDSKLLSSFPSTMDELDLPQMKREVESLQYQLAISREKSSITVTELVKWIEGCVCDDPFLNPELMRANPWVEKGKCVIL
ncbi:hypothetical protein DPEC_G00168300 [Dallia pectoralis]|uniref:Uncharacterized protein n=1 Tax=Dallia pectoralis TaxID=75939 RepID=A0ACC2GC56_DALPE|nr:hypothetical protein DPEC_G00168300 [Dallia pectoralis]